MCVCVCVCVCACVCEVPLVMQSSRFVCAVLNNNNNNNNKVFSFVTAKHRLLLANQSVTQNHACWAPSTHVISGEKSSVKEMFKGRIS